MIESQFRQKWIKIVNQASENKCRLLLKRMRVWHTKFLPFTKEQKFVFALIKSKLELIYAEQNTDSNITKLPRADSSDLNWKVLKTEKQIEDEIKKEINDLMRKNKIKDFRK